MANICITTYAFIGNEEQMNDLAKHFDLLKNDIAEGKATENISSFLTELGSVSVPPFGGRVVFISNDGASIRFSIETYWGRNTFVEKFLASKYIGSTLLFLEDCLEDDVFQTNDINHEIFKTRFAYDDDYIGLDYYEDEKSVLDAFNGTLGKVLKAEGKIFTNPCSSVDDLEDVAEIADIWVSLHQISYVFD